MNEKLVSVIIPVYNGENYVRTAIISVLNQTYKNIEIIVVNDGSTDSTFKVLNEFKDKIKIICKENAGSSSALNKGIEVMKGDFFVWLSHDDVFGPNTIQKRIDAWMKYNDKKVIVFSKTQFIDENGKRINRAVSKPIEINKVSDVYRSSINGCSLLIHKDIIKNKRFDESLVYQNDTDMWLSLVNDGVKFIPIKDNENYSRIHSNQVSVLKKECYEKDFRIVFDKYVLPLFDKKEYKELSSILLSLVVRSKLYGFYSYYIKKIKEFLKENKKYSFGLKIKVFVKKIEASVLYLLRKKEIITLSNI